VSFVAATLGASALLAATGCGGSGSTVSPAPPPPTEPTGRTLYVSTEGSDTASGRAGDPFRTIQHGVDRLRPADVLAVAPGTYPEDITIARSGRVNAPIRVQGASSGRPLVTGRLKITGDDVAVSGFIFAGRTAANPEDVAVYVSGASRVELFDNEIRDAAQSGLFIGDGARRIRVTRNWIHDNGRTVLDHGIYWERSAGGVIANNVIELNVGYGIQLYPDADGVHVTQNTVARNERSGIIVGGEETASDRNLIRNNIVALNGEQGIRTYWGGTIGHGNVAESNLVFGNGDDAATTIPGLVIRATINADPRFTNGAAGDYTLRPGSPAIDVAMAEYSEAVDFNGRERPQAAGPDLGAFERASVQP
jgi:hypothetical protein